MDIHSVARAKFVRIEDELASRGIFLKGSSERAGSCPVCGGRDRFSINVKKQVWNCRGCQTGGDVIALVEHIDGIEFKQAIAKLAGAPEMTSGRPNSKHQYSIPAQSDNAASAARIWQERRDPRGTLAETYLCGRGIELPEGDCCQFIRFHPACSLGQERFPALVSLIRNVKTNAPQAIQRTALCLDGKAMKRSGKTFRMTLGPTLGGAIKMTRMQA